MKSLHKISGKVRGKKSGTFLPGLVVEAWDKDAMIDDFLGKAITDAQGNFIIEFKPGYFKELSFDRNPDIYFKVFREDGGLLYDNKEVRWNVGQDLAGILLEVEEDVKRSNAAGPGIVRGTVANDIGLLLPQMRVVMFAKGITGDKQVGAGITDSKGQYLIHYQWEAGFRELGPDLLLKVFSTAEEKTEIGSAPVRYNASLTEIIDVIIPAARVPRLSEYERLLSDLRPLAGKTGLHGLRENDKKDNITLLSNKTGWDARMVAMAAQAEKLGRETGADPTHYYALFRAGAASDADSISRQSPAFLKKVLSDAAASKVIPEGSDIEKTLRIQAALHTESLLKRPHAAAVSTMDSMLDIRLKANEKKTFTECFKDAGGDMAKFWEMLPAKGIAAKTVEQLKLDGKMGYLTQHNAPLIKKLYQKHKISDPAELVSAGFYKAAAWKEFAGKDIPTGMTAEDYTEGLANMIKMSYPSAVTAEMVLNDEVKNVRKDLKKEVHAFLKKGSNAFTIGLNPVVQWEGFAALKPEVRAAVKRVERLYQLTPSDEAMTALSATDFNAAYDVMKCQRKEFVGKYVAAAGKAEDAEKIYSRSHEVYSASLSLATMYLTHKASPNVYGITGKTEKQLDEIIASPTLEELFGNMDYCSCDHCKSVLSPAAYMVDMLQFLDLSGLTFEGKNPLEVLLGRRPDLQHIQLSCENTNTVLPYIDLVNEILEHYILHGDLKTLMGHDVTEFTNAADLLADPEWVEENAYAPLKSAVYPYALPFDMSLEALKMIFKAFDASLPEALDIFGNPLSARKAWLGVNPLEYQILSNNSLHQLPEYFGEPAAVTIDDLNCSIANAKIFCRRMDISNEELVALLKTTFINPGIALLPLMENLALDSKDVIAMYEGSMPGPALRAKLPAGFSEVDYGGDVIAWLNSNKELIGGLIMLTDISLNEVECNFAEVQLRHFLPDKTKTSLCKDGLNAIDYHRFHRFIRLWKKLGWTISTLDAVITTFLPNPPAALTEANIDAAFLILLARMANFKKLLAERGISDKKIPAWLAIWNVSNSEALRTEALAKLIKMRVEDIRSLAEISGIDPLAADMQADSPSLLRFLKAIAGLKHIPVKLADLDYLLRSKDESGKLSLSHEKVLLILKALRDAMNAVDADLGTASADTGLSYARMKLSLVYDASVIDNFFSLLGNSKLYEVPFLMEEEYLPSVLSDKDPNLGYDPFRKQLTYAGILSDAAKQELKNLTEALLLADMGTITVQAGLDSLKLAIKAALDEVQIAGLADLTAFSLSYPELKTVYDIVKPISDPAGQSEALLKAILPDLAHKLKVNALQQILTAQLKCDPAITLALTTRPEVIAAVSDGAKPVLDDFLRLDRAPQFNDNKAFNFYLDPPATDDYILYVSAPAGTLVQQLNLGGNVVITAKTIPASGVVQNDIAVRLQAGIPVRVTLELAALPAGQSARLHWRTKGMAKTPVAAARLYDSALVDTAKASVIRLQKAALLQKLLKFSPEEYAWFAADSPETATFLNALDTDGSITAAGLHALWEKFYLLLYFTALKNNNEPEENTWLQIFRNPNTVTPAGNLLLAGLQGWDESEFNTALGALGLVLNDMTKLRAWQILIPAMDLVSKIGFPVATVIGWSTDAPTYDLIRTCKNQIRERTEGAAWLDTMQSISDPLRNMRRDALLSYILFHKRPADEINTADKLYEYFLIDVQMDACMKTSRIRGALSTIQLFVQRCLMSLEPEVSASSINSRQWDWMKRYRVWEANRKVFLYPENWLEPELRDGKSSFFSELEAELLGADINEELAESAFLSYLKKLDEVAKLEIVGTYLQEDPKGNQNDDILHVFGRTNGMTRQHYYRRYEAGYWTAWEKVTANIEGELLYPVVWRSRLYLFWLNILEKPADAAAGKPASIANQTWSQSAKKNIEINMCWAEYSKGKWTAPKSSELSDPMRIYGLSAFFPAKLILVGRKEVVNKRERLVFNIFYNKYPYSEFKILYTSKNVPPKVYADTKDDVLYDEIRQFLYDQFLNDYYVQDVPAEHTFNKFKILSREFNVGINQPLLAESPVIRQHLITQGSELFGGFRLLPTRHIIKNQWEAPLYFSDEHSTFYIKPDEQLTLAIWGYEDYYDIGIHDFTEYPVFVPPLREEPLIPDFSGPVINPVDEILDRKNVNIDKVLTTGLTFAFDKAVFGPGGKVDIKTGLNKTGIQ